MKRHKCPPFVMLPREMLKSEPWRALSSKAMIVYIYLKSGFNGKNNGDISFKYLDYKWLFAPGTISKALKELESKGWIEKTKYGGMFRYFCAYQLTGKYDASLRAKGWQNLYKTSIPVASVQKPFCVDMAKNEMSCLGHGP